MNLQHVANVVRGLAADGVEKANSGHPGLPLGCAEIGSVLFFDEMRHNPKDPKWQNRDRFVLSAGHGSMLLYSLLHLTGYDLALDELKRFRQLGSKTPGHPEYGHTAGVETTTGPLGQGIGNSVGMALAERMLAARFNKPDFPIVDYNTYVLCGDGDMMEGISGEASSLAGHLKLGKLTVIYDSNRISIEGSTELAFTESVKARYEAYGWHLQEIDGHSIEALQEALERAKVVSDRPSMIVAKTQIAKGAPTKANTAAAHGAPLGPDEIRALKEAVGLPDEEFYVSKEAVAAGRDVAAKGDKLQKEWNQLFAAYAKAYPDMAAEWRRAMSRELPEDIASLIPKFAPGDKLATRAASGKVLNGLAKALPNLVGGSADLAPSNNTHLDGFDSVVPGDYSGRNLHFGVREHGMASILNGMSLAGGFHVYGGTFLVFSDYLRPAVRLSALMKQPVIYVLTHDSIYVGEDGPTHQPVEHTESLRLIPNLRVYRPCDAEETAWAWLAALRKTDGPTALALTRQGLPVQEKPAGADFSKGAYVLREETSQLDITLAAAGSEVSLAMDAAKELESKGLGVRVVSVPCREIFREQDEQYRESVIPCDRPVMALEVGVGSGWYSLRPEARMLVFALDTFGQSGPGQEVADFYGFNVSGVIEAVHGFLGK